MGRKTHVVRNLTTWRSNPDRDRRRSAPTELDRVRELETENALLRARVADLNRELMSKPTSGPEDLTEPADDGSMEAFEAFLAESDPHIDRVQRFLLG